MKSARLIAGVLVAALAAPAGAASAPSVADMVKQWQAEIEKLRTEVRPSLERQLKAIQGSHANSNEVAPLRFACTEAQAAYDNFAKGDREVAAARKAEEQAAAAGKEAEAKALASDPTLGQIKAQLAEAKKAAATAETRRQAADTAFLRARSKIANSEEVAKLGREIAPKLGKAVDELAAKDPQVIAAQKAYNETLNAYEKALEALPEYKQRQTKPDAYNAARRALAEYKARNNASAACEAAYAAFMKSPVARAATAGRDNAEKAAKKRLDDLLTGSPEIVAQAAQRKAAQAAVQAAYAKVAELQKKYADAVSTASIRNPEALKARQAHETARATRRTLYETRLTAVEKARNETLAKYAAKLKERFEADPRVAEINKQILAVDAKIKEFQSQIDDIQRP